MVDIANAMGIPRSTLRIIRKQAVKVKESCKSAMRMIASEITQIGASVIKKLEGMLAQCIKHQHKHAIPLSAMVIQAKVKNLFDNQNAIEPDLKLQP
jgi:hypothetical protein